MLVTTPALGAAFDIAGRGPRQNLDPAPSAFTVCLNMASDKVAITGLITEKAAEAESVPT